MNTDTSARAKNPHIMQSENIITDIPFTRILSHDAPCSEYHRRFDKLKSALHWGQRKLLMSEIEFLLLTLTHEKKCTVIYAGAAPGTHVRALADMFPSHTFVLVDPAPFTVRPERERIIINQRMFTDELAFELRHSLRNTRILFISDVRSCDFEFHSDDVHSERMVADMQAQARWHGILLPFKSMLKFRLPYTPGQTRYLDGDIYLPVWGPPTTTECRLVVDTHSGTRIYNHTEHEQKMFFFNTVTRVALYPHSICGCGIDHCYDCMAEVSILSMYFNMMHPSIIDLNGAISKLSARISSSISSERTLAHANPEPSVRVSIIRKHQWCDGIPLYEQHIRQEQVGRHARSVQKRQRSMQGGGD